MIKTIKEMLSTIEESMIYMEECDAAWHADYTKLAKQRRILLKALKKLERLEEKS